mmetsp:Transcript_34462/g.112192  ORF Transcript_34462/g.112192 Transcript_34462/m.112192 type:complete len:499 (+) Transcript_34462:410-1906(+)
MFEHGHCESHAHAPTGRQVCDRLVEHLLWETNCEERVGARSIDTDVLSHLDAVLEGTEAALGHEAQLRVVDVHTLDILRHPDDAVVRDLLHERGLARSVLSHHTIPVVLLHLQGGVLQEQMPGTIHEQEALDIQQILVVARSTDTLSIEGIAQRQASHRLGNRGQLLHHGLGVLTVHLEEDLQSIGDIRRDLRAHQLLLLALHEDRTGHGAAEAAHLCRKRDEGSMRLNGLLQNALASARLPRKLGSARQLVQTLARHNGGCLAVGIPVGRGSEVKAHGSSGLVASRGLHLAGLHKLISNLGSMLLRAQAELAITHAQQSLLDAWHDQLLQLRSSPSILPCAVGVTLHGGVGVGPHQEDQYKDVLPHVLRRAPIRGEEILTKLFVFQDLVRQQTQALRALITNDLLAVPLVGLVAMQCGCKHRLEAGKEVIRAKVAESSDQCHRGLETSILVLILVAIDAHEHQGKETLDVRHEVHLHRVRHRIKELQESPADTGLLI